MKCPRCQLENQAGSLFCNRCGTQFRTGEPPSSVTKTLTIQARVEALTVGETLAGRFQVIEELGKGGMGRVFKAYDVEIDFNWAIGLNPNYATAYQYYGSLLSNLGRFDEAMDKFERRKSSTRLLFPFKRQSPHFPTVPVNITGRLSNGEKSKKGTAVFRGFPFTSDSLIWQKGMPRKRSRSLTLRSGCPAGRSPAPSERPASTQPNGRRGKRRPNSTLLLSGQNRHMFPFIIWP